MGKNIEVSKRIKMIADMVTDSTVVADIGCDHAYTSIYLVLNKRAKKVIAMDINKGPVKIAANNVALYGVEDKIDVRLSDGTAKLLKGEADTILISGMGGGLIVKILSMKPEVLSECKTLILSPQSEPWLLRAFLREQGFDIIYEDMVKEEGKFYIGIKAVNNSVEENVRTIHNKKESTNSGNIFIYDIYGKYLIDNKNEVLKEYLEYLKKQYENVLNGLEKAFISIKSEDGLTNGTDRIRGRKRELEEKLKDIEIINKAWKE